MYRYINPIRISIYIQLKTSLATGVSCRSSSVAACSISAFSLEAITSLSLSLFANIQYKYTKAVCSIAWLVPTLYFYLFSSYFSSFFFSQLLRFDVTSHSFFRSFLDSSLFVGQDLHFFFFFLFCFVNSCMYIMRIYRSKSCRAKSDLGRRREMYKCLF